MTAGIEAWGFDCKGVTESPIKGDKSGNTEFLAHFVRNPSKPVTAHLYGSSAAEDGEDRMLPGSLQGQVTRSYGDAANMDSDGRGGSNLSGSSVSSGSGSGVRRVKSTGSSKRGRTR